MKRKLAVIGFVALLVAGMSFSATAQLSGDNDPGSDDEEQNASSNISVTVTSTTAIDVKPEELSYGSMDVGAQETESDNEFGSVDLENIGSEYIDRVWVGASSIDTNPFGTGNPDNYNAGNFLQVKPSNTSEKDSIRGNTSTYHFVNRKEFQNSWDSEQGDIPSYIQADASDIDSGSDDVQIGRLRAGDEWYFYAIPVDSDNTCDGSSGPSIIRVGNSSHTPSDTGTLDFRDSSDDYTEYDIIESGGDYGIAANGPADETGVRLEYDGEYREYDLLTACDDSKSAVDEAHSIRTRYNPLAGDVPDLTAGNEEGDRTQFLLTADANDAQMLLPGEGIAIDTAVEVPQGVPEGTVEEGQLTVYVTSDKDASTT